MLIVTVMMFEELRKPEKLIMIKHYSEAESSDTFSSNVVFCRSDIASIDISVFTSTTSCTCDVHYLAS